MPCYKRKEIKKLLRSMSTPQLVEIHNRYLDVTQHPDPTQYPDEGRIYSMSDLDKVFAGKSHFAFAQDIYCSITQDKFHMYDLYFSAEKSGSLVSFNDARRYPSPVDFYGIADYIDDTRDTFGSDEIQKLLDEPGEYQKLRSAVEAAPTQENVNALGEWLDAYGKRCHWHGDVCFDADGIRVYRVYKKLDEDEFEFVGYELR